MRVEVLQGHTSLPAPASLLVAVLVKATPDARGVSTGAGPRPLHLGPCLGTSGSMNDQAGLYGGRRMTSWTPSRLPFSVPCRSGSPGGPAAGGRTSLRPSQDSLAWALSWVQPWFRRASPRSPNRPGGLPSRQGGERATRQREGGRRGHAAWHAECGRVPIPRVPQESSCFLGHLSRGRPPRSQDQMSGAVGVVEDQAVTW